MNLLFPIVERKLLLSLFGIAFFGFCVGGFYGILHDLFTYSISKEYFTLLKFHQFSWAEIGLPPHFHAAEIGFIATGAVGIISGWFLARTALPIWPFKTAFRKILQSFILIIFFAFTAGIVGYWLGLRHTGDYTHWQDLCDSLGVSDIPSFVRVAYIHNASYIGGFLGLILSLVLLRRLQKTEQGAAANP